jgi:TetR/AcrR family transcriptional regulator, tetracycline repressor protein
MRERPRQKRTPIEPEAVVRAALEILDAKGLEHVTLREIASRLGVQAPALYWHFKDKQDIVEDMAQVILKDARIDEIQRPKDIDSWAEWLAEVARSMRRALLSHREGGRVVAGASFFRARSLASLAILATEVTKEAGFDTVHASLAVAVVFDYVWGYVIEEQAGFGPEPKEISSKSDKSYEEVMEEIYQSDFGPQMKVLSAVVKEIDGLTFDERFEWGLQVIITGLKSTLRNTKNEKTKKGTSHQQETLGIRARGSDPQAAS